MAARMPNPARRTGIFIEGEGVSSLATRRSKTALCRDLGEAGRGCAEGISWLDITLVRHESSAMARIAMVQWKRFLIALAVSFGVAVLVNWGVLRLFGQKSADRAEHSLVGIILLMAYVSQFMAKSETRIGAVTFFLLALIPCYLGTVFPDLDITLLGIGAHRNPLFHSSLSFFVLLLLANQQHVILQALVLGYGVGLASHLLWDMVFYGNVRWVPGGGLDRLWLGANGIACLIPLLIKTRK
jgi:hypothetical protein